MLAIYIWHEEFSAVATHLPTFSLFVQTQYCNYIIKKNIVRREKNYNLVKLSQVHGAFYIFKNIAQISLSKLIL